MQLYGARQRRRLNRGLRRKQQSLLKRLRKAKKEAPPMEKPEVVKTHLRDMVILPEMVGSMVGVYNGKTFNQVEIKVRQWENLGFLLCLMWIEATKDMHIYKTLAFRRNWSSIKLWQMFSPVQWLFVLINVTVLCTHVICLFSP